MVALEPGTPVHLDFRKWDGQEHWQRDTIWLGTDEHGHWLGAAVGSVMHRPGVEVVTDLDDVMLLPAAPWSAAFYDTEDDDRISVYVDIATEPAWHLAEDPVRVSLIDLDLDVVRRGETTYLDDEDEFAEHRRLYGYPPDVVQQCEATASELLTAVTDRTGAFAPEVAKEWFGVLRALTDK